MDHLSNFDLENAELFSIVNKHSTQARRNSIKEESRLKVEETTKERYQPRVTKKPKGTLKKVIIGIVATGVIIGAGAKIIDSTNQYSDRLDFTTEISHHVRDNKYNTGTLQADGKPAYAYRSTDEIAEQTLNNNKDIDIDTRIYGTYTGLGDWNKDYWMDEIMENLQQIVTDNLLAYTEDEVKACNHSSFADYLASLGMEKDEYLDFMKDMTQAYANQDYEQVNELLAKLNGGGR